MSHNSYLAVFIPPVPTRKTGTSQLNSSVTACTHFEAKVRPLDGFHPAWPSESHARYMSSESKASVFVGEALHRSVHSTARNTQRARARHKADRPDTPHPGLLGPALHFVHSNFSTILGLSMAPYCLPSKMPVAGQNKATPKLEYVAAPLPPDGLRKPIGTLCRTRCQPFLVGLPSTTPRSKFTGPNSEPRNPFDFSTPRLQTRGASSWSWPWMHPPRKQPLNWRYS